MGNMPGQVGKVAYGACYNFDSEGFFDYICGVEVSGSGDRPAGLTTVQVPTIQYVVFTHRGHVSGIRTTYAAIWNNWFPESGHDAINAPTLERFGPEFNPTTGMGGFEIWIAIKA
jgi:AraC family transcriptional regulator